MSGEFRSGRFACILGPSGVGKTTFLNVLCGRAPYGTATGRVVISSPDDAGGDGRGRRGRGVGGARGRRSGARSGGGGGGGSGGGSGGDEVSSSLSLLSSSLPPSASQHPPQHRLRRGSSRTAGDNGGFSSGGVEMSHGVRPLTHVVGLVPQEDTMHGWLTVRENLWLYARLKHRASPLGPAAWPAAAERETRGGAGAVEMTERRRGGGAAPMGGSIMGASGSPRDGASVDDAVDDKVDSVMRVLGLWPLRHAFIGGYANGGGGGHGRGLSGGQRKRVNVAMELVLDPSVRWTPARKRMIELRAELRACGRP